MTDDEVARLIGKSYEQRTPKTLTRLEGPASRTSKAARKSGVALDREEHTLGICAAGIVMTDFAGNHVAISVPVPAQRFAVQQARIAKSLLATKRALSRAAGGAARLTRPLPLCSHSGADVSHCGTESVTTMNAARIGEDG